MSEKRFKVNYERFIGNEYLPCGLIDMRENSHIYKIEDVCDLLNELNKDFEDCEKLLDSKDSFIHRFKRDIEELGISIKLFEDDIATKDKKIEEQQAIMTKLRNENIILKNKIEDLRVSLFMQDQVLQRQMQKSDLDE